MKISNRYGLHDTEVNGISFNEKGIELIFEKGVYNLDENGKEIDLTGRCTISIQLKWEYGSDYEQHIEVNAICKNKIKEVRLDKFATLLNETSLEIYMDYYSPFSDALMLKGYMGKNKIELIISEIEEISYNFNTGIHNKG